MNPKISVNLDSSDALSTLGETLGRRVREVWVIWAKEQMGIDPDPKLHWLTPWDELDEPSKEVDRRIGLALWGDFINAHTEAIVSHLIQQMECSGRENRRKK